MKSIQAQLEELGLGEKEVKVYLASLELGSATVQQIAGKSGVVRASSYVAIGGLTNRGLMSTYTKGKKKFFTAEAPDKLLKLLQEKRKKLADQESRLKEVMPELQALISLSVDKPEVNYYEGLEGLEVMREKIFESKAKELLVVGVPEKLSKAISDESRVIHNMRLEKSKVSGKYIILTSGKGVPKPPILFKNWDYKLIKKRELSSGAEISIFSDYISLLSYQDKPYGFIIQSKEIVALAKIMFEATWKSSVKNTWQ